MSVWDALVGQQDTARTLAEAAEGVGMTPSWLFTGPAGSGRSVAARSFAAALECETGTGCGHCSGCAMVLAETHPDVAFVRPEGLSLGVAEARALVLQAAARPTVGRWRVLLLEDADRLTETAANALLKVLEEPPERTVILLCAPSVDDVLPTVRSRCRLVPLRTPTSRDVADVLESRGIDAAMAAFAARAAQGHVGRARRLATDEQARLRRADVLRLPTRLGSVAECLAAAADLVDAASEEADQLSSERDSAETAELQATLAGGQASAGARASARGAAVQVRGAAGALKDLEKRQKSRAKRAQLDALDRALVDLAAWYRDVLAVQVDAVGPRAGTSAGVEWVHDDQRAEIEREARESRPEQTLRRLEAVLTCRSQLQETPGLAPLLAVEALALALRAA